jgi:transcriptional regulator with XRE-family HTH domain
MRQRDKDVTGTMKLIPAALRRVREGAGLRQVDVVHRTGMSKAMVSSFESGRALPSLPSLASYLCAIGRDLSDLQEALDQMGPSPKVASGDLPTHVRALLRAVREALRGLDELGIE